VVVVCGASATGKTDLATRLAAVSGWPHLASDVVRKRALGLDPTARAPDDAYTTTMNEHTYSELGCLARAEISAGAGAIVDATFRFRSDRGVFMRALGAGAADTLFIECRAPAGVLAERAAKRERDTQRFSDADAAQVELQQEQFESLDEVPPGDHVTLRTDRPVDLIVDDVEDVLDARLA
jgi:predicted kinase